MPLTRSRPYTPPFWLHNRHALTIWPAVFRKPNPLPASRTRLATADGDFVDVDFMPVTPGERSRRAVILSHGLEGHSRRPYMLGMAHALHSAGWDVLSRNLRH